jgi:hypothetical protein
MLDCQLKKYYSSRETEQMIFNLLSIFLSLQEKQFGVMYKFESMLLRSIMFCV